MRSIEDCLLYSQPFNRFLSLCSNACSLGPFQMSAGINIIVLHTIVTGHWSYRQLLLCHKCVYNNLLRRRCEARLCHTFRYSNLELIKNFSFIYDFDLIFLFRIYLNFNKFLFCQNLGLHLDKVFVLTFCVAYI